ncbi:MAG: hypothetical protein NTX61_05890 [Bacteroidetes bacterium]|nr:hypothetical protein [Bacteroidota bacterium]
MPTIEFTHQEIEFLRKKYEKELEEGLNHIEYLRNILTKIKPTSRDRKGFEEQRKPGRPRKIRSETLVPGIGIPEKTEKRKPGRPKKIKSETPVQEIGIPEKTEKRKPGRPKKSKSEMPVQEIGIPGKTENRKPGRAKKIKSETPVQEIIIPEKTTDKKIVAKPKSKKTKKTRVIIAKKQKEVIAGAKKPGRPTKVVTEENVIIPVTEIITPSVEKSE